MQSLSLKLLQLRCPIFIPTKKEPKCSMFSFTRPPFFHMLTEEGVATMFLRTVASDIDQARAFVSKNSELDLYALQNILSHCVPTMINLKKAGCGLRNGITTRSILLQNCILHLHMIEESDQFGQWKVYGVDKESQ